MNLPWQCPTGNSLWSQSQSHITTDGQSVNNSWCRAPIWGSWPDTFYCLTVTVLFLWGALSNERTGLSFVYAAGPCQRSLSWNSRPYFTASDSRLPFSSPPTTCRVAVEVFDPASTREDSLWTELRLSLILSARTTHRKHSTVLLHGADHIENTASYNVACWNVFTEPLPRNMLHNPVVLL
jgi:hypothetical protein